MNKKFISAVSCAAALALGLTGISSPAFVNDNSNSSYAVVSTVSAAETMRNISSAELVKDMGLGWNLGNTFDSLCAWIQNGTPEQYETGWGNPVTKKEVIKKYVINMN